MTVEMEMIRSSRTGKERTEGKDGKVKVNEGG